jgi:hypothetical protein
VLGGVQIAAGGDLHITTTSGSASVSGLYEPSLNVIATRQVPDAEAVLAHDAVNLSDAIAILKMIVGLDVNGTNQPLSAYQAFAADFDGNGTANLNDAIGVLKHVVGLAAPTPTWHFVNEADLTVPSHASMSPGALATTITANLNSNSTVHLGLVGILSGDVDGSFSGVAGTLDLDETQSNYFVALTQTTGLNLSQFGIYPHP